MSRAKQGCSLAVEIILTAHHQQSVRETLDKIMALPLAGRGKQALGDTSRRISRRCGRRRWNWLRQKQQVYRRRPDWLQFASGIVCCWS